MLIFNGEVYNHLDLRNEFLSEVQFKSTSDTETIIQNFDIHTKWEDDLELEISNFFISEKV